MRNKSKGRNPHEKFLFSLFFFKFGRKGPLGFIIVLFIEFDTIDFLTSYFLGSGFFYITFLVPIFLIDPVYYGFLKLETVETLELILLTDDLLLGTYADILFNGSFFIV